MALPKQVKVLDKLGKMSREWFAALQGADAVGSAPIVLSSPDASLPNARVLTAGTNVTLDTSTPGQIKVNASGGGGADLSTANEWTANQRVKPVTLTDGANISTNALLSNNFRVVLGGNRTLDNPTNLVDGMTLNWVIVQDATGSRTLTFGSAFDWGGGAAPFLSTAAGAIDMVSAYYDATSGKLLASFRRGT